MSVKIELAADILRRKRAPEFIISIGDENDFIAIPLQRNLNHPFNGAQLNQFEIISLIKILMRNISFYDKKKMAEYAKQIGVHE